MHASTFIFFSAAATFLGQATGLPRIHYVWTQQTTEILDDDSSDYCNTAAGDICPWTPHRLPMVLNDNVPFDTDTDIDSTDNRLAGPGGDTDHHTTAPGVDVKVGVPAVVYPHDSSPTPTAKVDVATKVACPSTLSTSTLMKLQPRDATRDVEVADIPKSIKSEESHGAYPGQIPAPLAFRNVDRSGTLVPPDGPWSLWLEVTYVSAGSRLQLPWRCHTRCSGGSRMAD